METPWEVVGWVETVSEKGTKGCRLFLEQDMILPAGATGQGKMTKRVWYNMDDVPYPAQIGHKVIVIPDDRNENIARRIIVVG